MLKTPTFHEFQKPQYKLFEKLLNIHLIPITSVVKYQAYNNLNPLDIALSFKKAERSENSAQKHSNHNL